MFFHKPENRVRKQAGKKKRDHKSGCVDRDQEKSLCSCRGACGHHENAGQRRTDAGSPRKAERKSQEESRQRRHGEHIRWPGQRQRVAIGRAIVREPKVFLMDEPLSNLDAKLRNQMRAEILTLRKRIDTTFVYVTHDQTEAMTLGDRIVIMKDGFIQQVGTPREVFAHPANQFVGGFIGTPQMNFFQGELLKENGRFWAQVGAYRVQLSDEKQERLFAADVQPQQVTVGVRPEHLQLAKAGIPAELGVREMMGSSVHLHLTAMEQDVVAVVSGMDDSGHFMNDIPASGQVFLSFHGNAVHLFDPASETNLEWPSTHRKVDSENFMEETVLPD